MKAIITTPDALDPLREFKRIAVGGEEKPGMLI